MATSSGPDGNVPRLPDVSGFFARDAENSRFLTHPEFAPAALQALVRHFPGIISLFDVDGIHQFASRVLPGTEPGSVLGRHISELVPERFRSEVARRFRHAIESRKAEEFATPAIEPDGARLTYHGWFVPIVLENQVLGAMAVVTDAVGLFERHASERQTRRMLDELARVSRVSTMREMASGLAHELNQPLSAIVAYVDACLELVESGRMDNSQLAGVLQSVSSQAERAGAIIHRLRQMIKRDQPARVQMSINDAVSETVELLDSEARQSGVTIHTELEQGLPEVHADLIQIQHVLLNLLHNGIDSMREVPQNRRQLTVATSRIAEREVEVAISDHGHGLSDEAASRLFEPFFSTRPNGLGLGLSITRTIVESHGGRLDVTSNSDAGVTARFNLPVSDEEGDHVGTADRVHC